MSLERKDSGSSLGEHGTSAHQMEEPFGKRTGLKKLYYHPTTQVVMLGIVCFMCPGLFNALNGLGAGGQVDSETSAQANAALYATFAVIGFVGGTVNNTIGPRMTLFIGSLGYSLYIGSYLAMNIHPGAGGFVVAAGAILGVCAGLLWTAQGSLMMGYPTEQEKGKYIAIFWGIFNLGAVVGASVALGTNFDSEAGQVSNATYIAFVVLTLIGTSIPLLMADPAKMLRTDGSVVVTPRQPSWKSEIRGLYICLKTDPYVIILFPMFFASNWFYTWQFNAYNGAVFNIRARSLNSVCYWMSQIFGSIMIGFLLDRPNLSRRTRAYAGWTVLLVMVFIVHGWAYKYQKGYERGVAPIIDIYDDIYPEMVWAYIFMGLLDAMWQTTAYWLMGAMSNDPSKLAYFAGFYKSLQSAGAAGAWAADADKISYMSLFISTWVLLVAGLLFTLPMMFARIKDHTELVDETIARMDADGNILDEHVVAARIAEAPVAQTSEKV